MANGNHFYYSSIMELILRTESSFMHHGNFCSRWNKYWMRNVRKYKLQQLFSFEEYKELKLLEVKDKFNFLQQQSKCFISLQKWRNNFKINIKYFYLVFLAGFSFRKMCFLCLSLLEIFSLFIFVNNGIYLLSNIIYEHERNHGINYYETNYNRESQFTILRIL